MIELLPILLGVLCGLTLRRLWRCACAAGHTFSGRNVQLCGSGTYAELDVYTYRLGDSLRQLCGGSSCSFWCRPFLALTQNEVTQEFIT